MSEYVMTEAVKPDTDTASVTNELANAEPTVDLAVINEKLDKILETLGGTNAS